MNHIFQSTIIKVLKCFFCASGLSINMHKSKLMGIDVDDDIVNQAAHSIGCLQLKSPFSYLGSRIGGSMSRINSWDDIVNKLLARLSKWKMKTLSIGGRLTLLKSVLGSTPIYYMSVLKRMESIRSRFFNGLETCKQINVASKLVHDNVRLSLRRMPRGGVELEQFTDMINSLADFQLPNMQDRWFWSLSGSGDFSVASVRKIIDDHLLPEVSSHLFFACYMARDIFRNIASWWDVKSPHVSSFKEWDTWTSSLTLSSRRKHILE
ncbi:hypothetical protein Tco_0786152, partial [Tanacetum coccineum]